MLAEALKSQKGDAGFKGCSHVENTYCAQWWLNVVFMNSEGQKSWRSHDFILVPTEPSTIYTTKKPGAALLRQDKF